jgi:hypothetical protein
VLEAEGALARDRRTFLRNGELALEELVERGEIEALGQGA